VKLKLEDQLEKLKSFGVILSPAVTIDDLLTLCSRARLQRRPYERLLPILGATLPHGDESLPVSPSVLYMDANFYCDPLPHTKAIRHLCNLSGSPNRITSIEEEVDDERNIQILRYVVAGAQRNREIDLSDPWAEIGLLAGVLDDIEYDQRYFYTVDSGEGMAVFYLKRESANEINQKVEKRFLRRLRPVNPDSDA
jgi:hypothetical protein